MLSPLGLMFYSLALIIRLRRMLFIPEPLKGFRILFTIYLLLVHGEALAVTIFSVTLVTHSLTCGCLPKCYLTLSVRPCVLTHIVGLTSCLQTIGEADRSRFNGMTYSSAGGGHWKRYRLSRRSSSPRGSTSFMWKKP